MPDHMVLAQAVLNIFFDKITLLHKMPKSEKGHNSFKYLYTFAKGQSGHLHLE